ncbi:hypothetical protein [Serratia sp. CY85251]|uniref:hypothetical protein n=1 Tax=Serratia sp. CY85251 TaxID=3383696 RepID=UPI003FA0B790
MLKVDQVIEIVKLIIDSDDTIDIYQDISEIQNWNSVNALRLYAQLGKYHGKKIPVIRYMEAKTIFDIAQLVSK